MIIVDLKQGSPEWHLFRNEKIGASDAPIIMGVSPWNDLKGLYRQKCRGQESVSNAAMMYGRQNEEPARLLFEAQTGLTVFPAVGMHEIRTWQVASFDGLSVDHDVLVEIKCANEKDHASAKSGKVPDKYYPQLQHQLAVSGLDSLFYFSYRGALKEGVQIVVKRDEEYIDKLIEREEQFYFRCMVLDIEPGCLDESPIAV